MSSNSLESSLTISQAVGLGITIVVGSGLLLLPGLAYMDAGGSSIHVWIICALLVIPLLVIFSVLGSKYPTAGGVAGFMQHAFSRHVAGATEVMLLGTFGLGIPAIALTGSYYFNAFFGIDSQASDLVALAVSLLMIWLAFLVNYLGTSTSGNVQKFLAIILVVAITSVPVLSFMFADDFGGEGITPVADVDIGSIFPLVGMVFFAFTGWEMLSFTIEEYKNPERDYPISVALSFLIVVALYFLLVLSIQMIVPVSNPLLATAPLSALLQHVFGDLSGRLMALLSFFIIMANLIGAVWAASRLVFSSAREGLLPAPVSYLSQDRRIPVNALLVSCLSFSLIIVINYLGIFAISDLLRLAGQNFFILYGMAVLAYIKISEKTGRKIFGIATMLVVLATMGTFGIELLYPAVLLSFGYWASRQREVVVKT